MEEQLEIEPIESRPWSSSGHGDAFEPWTLSDDESEHKSHKLSDVGRRNIPTVAQPGRIDMVPEGVSPLAQPPLISLGYKESTHSTISKATMRLRYGSLPEEYDSIILAEMDLHVEHDLLQEYLSWAETSGESKCAAKNVFRRELCNDLCKEIDEVRGEWMAKFEALTGNFFKKEELQRWEHTYLDPDGGTTRIVRELKEGRLIFWSDHIREKYKYLEPRREDSTREVELARLAYASLDWRRLSQPPDFDYDDFIQNILPSDLRFRKLFPGSRQLDYSNRTNYRDYKTERELLEMYITRLEGLQRKDPESTGFYEALLFDLRRDHSVIAGKDQTLYQQAGDLEKWEYTFLDQDGDTKGVKRKLRNENDQLKIFWCVEAVIKYGHLSPKAEFREYAKWKKAEAEQKEKEERQKRAKTQTDVEIKRKVQQQQKHAETHSYTSSIKQPPKIVRVAFKCPPLLESTHLQGCTAPRLTRYHAIGSFQQLEPVVSIREVIVALQTYSASSSTTPP